MEKVIGVVMPTEDLQRKFDRILHSYLLKAVQDITNKLQQTAKEDHRYKHKTRNLRNSTDVKYKESPNAFDITLKVDLRKAEYGKWIIRGHGSWQPDPFLNDAMKKEDSYINGRIQKAVNDAVAEMNR